MEGKLEETKVKFSIITNTALKIFLWNLQSTIIVDYIVEIQGNGFTQSRSNHVEEAGIK